MQGNRKINPLFPIMHPKEYNKTIGFKQAWYYNQKSEAKEI